MKEYSILLGSLLVIATSVAYAANPTFKDYIVTPVFTGTNHEPVLQEHSNSMMDKARAHALKGKVNFAGHYILYRVGCGGSAICGEVLDARTGEVVGGLPNAYDGNALSLSNRPDSRLLIVTGIAADTEEDAQGNELEIRYRTRYFEFVNNEFRLLTFKDL
ncbi:MULTISPECIES: hypothetical protein [unclassified Pseudomonas]|uniref:hypothetical protein n=1 Tax=unclassified Pseudomonas TaxID=196821 RepID=UPI001481F96B|nr:MULTISPECIES: hypothetical protein [unclassified Pseudomonas]MDI2141228.1 hypothetical protein [Pseudomonas sp. ITA]